MENSTGQTSPKWRRDRPVKLLLVGGCVASAALGLVLWLALPVFTPIDELATALVDQERSAMHPAFYLRWHLNHVRSVNPFARSAEGDALAQHLLARYRPGPENAARNAKIFSTLELLSRRGLSVDVTSARSGTNAMHDAVLAGYGEVVGVLLARGANPNLPVQLVAGPPLAGLRPLSLVSRMLERGLASEQASQIAEQLRSAGGRP